MALLVKNSVSLPFSKLQFLYCKMGIITPVYKIKRVNGFVGYKGLVLLLNELLLLALVETTLRNLFNLIL